MWHSHLNDLEIPVKTKHFIPKGFELGSTLSWPNRSVDMDLQGSKKLEFQHVLWASISNILLGQDHFLLILINGLVRGGLSLSLTLWGSEL